MTGCPLDEALAHDEHETPKPYHEVKTTVTVRVVGKELVNEWSVQDLMVTKADGRPGKQTFCSPVIVTVLLANAFAGHPNVDRTALKASPTGSILDTSTIGKGIATTKKSLGKRDRVTANRPLRGGTIYRGTALEKGHLPDLDFLRNVVQPWLSGTPEASPLADSPLAQTDALTTAVPAASSVSMEEEEGGTTQLSEEAPVHEPPTMASARVSTAVEKNEEEVVEGGMEPACEPASTGNAVQELPLEEEADDDYSGPTFIQGLDDVEEIAGDDAFLFETPDGDLLEEADMDKIAVQRSNRLRQLDTPETLAILVEKALKTFQDTDKTPKLEAALVLFLRLLA